ncbi:unnamed protein product, partial [Adineta steineri]
SVNQTQFQPVPLKQMQNVVKFDMKLLFFHDPTVQNQTISWSLICSQDVFDIETVEELSKQFQHLLSQLIVKSSTADITWQKCGKRQLTNLDRFIEETQLFDKINLTEEHINLITAIIDKTEL